MKRFVYLNIIFLSIISFFIPLEIKTEDLDKAKKNLSQEIIQEEVSYDNSTYLIGPGDVLNLNLYGSPEFSGQYLVLNDGYVNLPIIGNVKLVNMSLEEANNFLEKKYSKDLLMPSLHLDLFKLRPLNISIIGEVAKPGSYRIQNEAESMIFPRIVDGIQKAGGINSSADLENVSVIRNFRSKGISSKIVANVNLISLLEEGDQSQNIPLHHGDIIKINKSNNLTEEQYKLAKANLSPSRILVSVVGEVLKPIDIDIRSGSSMVEAIMRAGGPIQWQADHQHIQLIRESENGSVTVKRYKLDLSKEIAKDNNPILRDGDVINVKTNSLTTVSRGLKAVTAPMSDIITAIATYKLLD